MNGARRYSGARIGSPHSLPGKPCYTVVVLYPPETMTMPAATLTEKGQIVIPAEIRARYELTPGTQVEFVDEGGTIRLMVKRRVAVSDPAAGFGLVKVKPARSGTRRLADFDAARLLRRPRPKP